MLEGDSRINWSLVKNDECTFFKKCHHFLRTDFRERGSASEKRRYIKKRTWR